jgi:hypothetical protein
MSLVIKMDSTDVLTEVLSTLGIQGQVFCCSELSAPWSMALPASSLAHFHVLEQGSAWLQLAGESAVVPLASGDFLMLPHGSGHVLSDSPETPPVLLEHLLAQSQGGSPRLAQGGGSAETRLICGSFHFAHVAESPLLPCSHLCCTSVATQGRQRRGWPRPSSCWPLKPATCARACRR